MRRGVKRGRPLGSGTMPALVVRDLSIVLGAFVVVSALAGLLGAPNLGTALSFGQIGFALALVYVLVKR